MEFKRGPGSGFETHSHWQARGFEPEPGPEVLSLYSVLAWRFTTELNSGRHICTLVRCSDLEQNFEVSRILAHLKKNTV